MGGGCGLGKGQVRRHSRRRDPRLSLPPSRRARDQHHPPRSRRPFSLMESAAVYRRFAAVNHESAIVSVQGHYPSRSGKHSGSERDRVSTEMSIGLSSGRNAAPISDLLAAWRESGIIDRPSALRLAEEATLDELLVAASQVRARGKGTIVSFSKKVFIPLTTLCRDYCGYCTFRKDPGQPGAHFMTPDEVLGLAERAREAGCKEALFSLGDQPERIFPEARDFLRQQGFTRTLDYAAAMCELVLERTGLLPHANPGVMDGAALARFKESNASVGLMLGTVSSRLMPDGLAHFRAPDKVPALRLRTIEEAGKLSMAFTTGILIGISETFEERLVSLFAIRVLHEGYGHIQEVIRQNFSTKRD